MIIGLHPAQQNARSAAAAAAGGATTTSNSISITNIALVCLPDDGDGDGSTAPATAAAAPAAVSQAARVLAASGLAQRVCTMQLHGGAGPTQLAPQLLSCPSRHGGARLLTCVQPTPAGGQEEAADRTRHVVLQHAAVLLLALVSDSMLLLLPPSATGALPSQLLQLLDALQAVHTQLLQQAQAQASLPGPPHQLCSSSSSSSSRLAQLLLDRKQPVQLHIGVQVPAAAGGGGRGGAEGGEPTAASSWQAAAGSAVQAATQALRTCRAVLQPSAAASRSSSSRGGVLMKLAGVHACCSDGGPNSVHAARRAVLHAIDRQLVLLNGQQQLQQQQQQAVPADTLPGPEQLLAHVAAHAAAACSSATHAGSRPVVHLPAAPQLWMQLLQLLFPDAALASSDSSSSSFLCNLFAQQPLVSASGDMQSDDETASDDGGNNSSSCPDGSEEEAWDEVQQQPDEGDHQQAQQHQHQHQHQHQQRRRQQAPGQLLAAAASPGYAASVRRCRRAAKQAVRGYLQAVPPQRYTAAVHDSALAAALQQFGSSASGPAAGELRQLLLATCRGLWTADRQQCPARSLTGHACTRGLHDDAPSDQQQEQQQHSSGRRWCSYTPDGAAAASVDDSFSLHAANTAPAEQLLAERQSGLLLPVSVWLALSGPPHQLESAPAASLVRPSSGPLHQLSLGPWMSSWFSRAAASSDAGMPGPGWLPGQDRLWQLQVPRLQVQPAAGNQPAAQQPKPGKAQQPQPQNQQRPQKQQQRETLAAQLKRSVLGAPAPDPELGPADFPTLQQAAGTGRRQRAAARTASSQQPQQELVAAWSDMLRSRSSVGGSTGSAPVLTSVWVGLEYERSSDGARAILQPQQLLALLAHQQQQQQQPANSRSRQAAGAAPQQQHRQRDMAAGRRPPPVAAATRAAGQAPASSAGGSASLSLLSADVPLVIVLPADDSTGRAAAPAAGDSTMQLRRLLVRTPPGPFVFASQPRLACNAAEQQQQQQHAGAGGTGRLEFFCQQRLRLPPDTLVSLCLPRVLAAPVDWVHTINAAAAASVADAAAELHVAAATAPTAASDSPDSSAQARMLLPLIPMAAAGSSSSDGSSGAPPAWRGVLCAGSWLFPDSDPAGSPARGA